MEKWGEIITMDTVYDNIGPMKAPQFYVFIICFIECKPDNICAQKTIQNDIFIICFIEVGYDNIGAIKASQVI